MQARKRILLKITGEAFLSTQNNALDPLVINQVIGQIKQLEPEIHFGIVVGGGNFFRGNQHGKAMGISSSVGHQIGIIGTLMNGLIIKDLLEQQNIKASLLTAFTCPEIGAPISDQTIHNALNRQDTIIFAGGTGNPFFSTDTTAVLRGLQMDAQEIWKASHIDSVYTDDPKKNSNAKPLKDLTFKFALENNLGIMDATAFALAAQNKQTIRVFSLFEPNALLNAAKNSHFGSLIHV